MWLMLMRNFVIGSFAMHSSSITGDRYLQLLNCYFFVLLSYFSSSSFLFYHAGSLHVCSRVEQILLNGKMPKSWVEQGRSKIAKFALATFLLLFFLFLLFCREKSFATWCSSLFQWKCQRKKQLELLPRICYKVYIAETIFRFSALVPEINAKSMIKWCTLKKIHPFYKAACKALLPNLRLVQVMRLFFG